MEWNKYTIHTTTAAVEAVSGLLITAGITGFEIEDNVQLTEEEKKKTFSDILPPLPPDDGMADISFYLVSGKGEVDTSLLNNGMEIDGEWFRMDEGKVIDQIKGGLTRIREFVDIGAGTIERYVTRDEDWANSWKQYFKPIVVGDLLILPSWEEPQNPEGYRAVIQIDPGNAFGTGSHATTRLCLEVLDDLVQEGDQVLDLGCGSGILAIASLKLGAAWVDGVDIDPAAIRNAGENFKNNRMEEYKYALHCGNVLEQPFLLGRIKGGQYNLVVVNILADVILKMSPLLPGYLAPGGVVVASGILGKRESEVAGALQEAGLSVKQIHREGDWVCMVCGRDSSI